eukprot:68247-Rhodomonas_salina.1
MALPAAAPATHGLQPASEPRPGGLGMCGAAANASSVLSSGARNDSTASAAPQWCLERQAAYARVHARMTRMLSPFQEDFSRVRGNNIEAQSTLPW